MRGLLLGLLLVLLPSCITGAVGGLAINGIGSGTTYGFHGSGVTVCERHPLRVTAAYPEPGKAVVDLAYLPAEDCPTSNGGAFFVGHSSITPGVPPTIVPLIFACSGSEGQGATCHGTDNFGAQFSLRLGPYKGLGSTMAVFYQSETRYLIGTVTAI